MTIKQDAPKKKTNQNPQRGNNTAPYVGRDWRKMSYEILKYVSFNKKEQAIYVTSACNNCRPLTYERYKYSHKDMTFEQDIEYFFVSMLEGNYQGGQKKIKDMYNKLLQLKKYATVTSFDKDLALGVGRNNGLNHLIAKVYAVPAILNRNTIVSQSIIDAIRRYDAESATIYKEAEKEYANKGWLITRACSRSDIFQGWNLYEIRSGYGEGYILAEHACYEQAKLGFCNTKAGRTIRIPKYEGNVWWTLSSGFNKTFAEIKESNEKTAELLSSASFWKLFEGLKMSKLPFKDFPYELYGFKLEEAA